MKRNKLRPQKGRSEKIRTSALQGRTAAGRLTAIPPRDSAGTAEGRDSTAPAAGADRDSTAPAAGADRDSMAPAEVADRTNRSSTSRREAGADRPDDRPWSGARRW